MSPRHNFKNFKFKLHFSTFAAYRKHSKWRVMMQEKVVWLQPFPFVVVSGASVIKRRNVSFLHAPAPTCVRASPRDDHTSLALGNMLFYLLFTWAHARMHSNSRTHRRRSKATLSRSSKAGSLPVPLPFFSEEALWREVYHLQSLNTKCRMSYGCIFRNALEWRKGKISQHSLTFLYRTLTSKKCLWPPSAASLWRSKCISNYQSPKPHPKSSISLSDYW